jgi:ornithine--oxo-acid transaminase
VALNVRCRLNTGAEAVETAIKLARRWGYRVKGIPADAAEIIVFSNNFHGRTTAIVSASTDPAYRADFGPFMPGFTFVKYGRRRGARTRDLGEHLRDLDRTYSKVKAA